MRMSIHMMNLINTKRISNKRKLMPEIRIKDYGRQPLAQEINNFVIIPS